MPYTPTEWKDRIVEHPLRFIDQNGNTWIFTPQPGAITQEGTLFSATLANKFEQGLAGHTEDTTNPHAVTKAQVGLGSVQNYGVATQAEAEAGASTAKYVTPLRVKEYVDTRLENGIEFRISSGVVQYFNGATWKAVGGVKSVQRGTATVTGGNTVDVTISSVDLNKSVVILSSVYDNNADSATYDWYVRTELTSATNLKFISGGSRPGVPVGWQVIEYY